MVSHVHVGEHRIAAMVGDLHPIENGPHGRAFGIGDVGVPDAAEVVAVGRLLGDVKDFRMAVDDGGDILVLVKFAEIAAEGLVLLRR